MNIVLAFCHNDQMTMAVTEAYKNWCELVTEQNRLTQ